MKDGSKLRLTTIVDRIFYGLARRPVLTAIGKTPRLLYLIPQRELDINRHFNQNE